MGVACLADAEISLIYDLTKLSQPTCTQLIYLLRIQRKLKIAQRNSVWNELNKWYIQIITGFTMKSTEVY